MITDDNHTLNKKTEYKAEEHIVVVFLDGHGGMRDEEETIDRNYSIIYPVQQKTIMTIEHSLLVMNLIVNPPLNMVNSLEFLESIPTTDVINSGNIKQHYLKTAIPDFPVGWLFPSKITNNRFLHFDVEYKFDSLEKDPVYLSSKHWLENNPFILEIDRIETENQIHQIHSDSENILPKLIALSSNIIYLHPATENIISGSYIMNEMLPKLRVLVAYQIDRKVDILKTIFDYRNDVKLNESEAKERYPDSFRDTRDIYHELYVPNNAKIIWNCCRNNEIPTQNASTENDDFLNSSNTEVTGEYTTYNECT